MLIPLASMQRAFCFPITGALHVGAHTCEEATAYAGSGVERVIWVDADAELVAAARKRGFDVHECVAWDVDGESLEFNVTSNAGESSSVLALEKHSELYPDIRVVKTVHVTTQRLDTYLKRERVDLDGINFLNIDVQGAELQVLRGLGGILDQLDAVYAEVNIAHLYGECALIGEMDEFLSAAGFRRAKTAMTESHWGDALYLRARRTTCFSAPSSATTCFSSTSSATNEHVGRGANAAGVSPRRDATAGYEAKGESETDSLGSTEGAPPVGVGALATSGRSAKENAVEHTSGQFLWAPKAPMWPLECETARDNSAYMFLDGLCVGFGETLIDLDVTAASDVHLLLVHARGTFEVVLGAYANRVSLLRLEPQGEPVQYFESTLGSGSNSIILTQGANRAVLQLNGSTELVVEGDFERITSVGIHTGYGSAGRWAIRDPAAARAPSPPASTSACTASAQSSSKSTGVAGSPASAGESTSGERKSNGAAGAEGLKEDNGGAEAVLVTSASATDYVAAPDGCLSKSAFRAHVDARSDAHVLLTLSDKSVMEVVLGGWANSCGVLRKAVQGNRCASSAKAILPKSGWAALDILRDGQRWTVALDGKGVLEWMLTDGGAPSDIVAAAVHTGWGASGRWRAPVSPEPPAPLWPSVDKAVSGAGTVYFQAVGRLGNNLFQYFAAHIVRKALGKDSVQVEPQSMTGDPSTITDEGFVALLGQSGTGRVCDTRNLCRPGDLFLCGFFQRSEVFSKHRALCKSLFTAGNADALNHSGDTIGQLVPADPIALPDDEVVIHVRLGDFDAMPGGSHIIHPHEYLEWLGKMDPPPGRITVVVDRLASDEERAYVAHLRKKLRERFRVGVLLQQGALAEDFQYMMAAKRIVLSHSTFSYLAAFLGNPALVVVPYNPLFGGAEGVEQNLAAFSDACSVVRDVRHIALNRLAELS